MFIMSIPEHAKASKSKSGWEVLSNDILICSKHLIDVVYKTLSINVPLLARTINKMTKNSPDHATVTVVNQGEILEWPLVRFEEYVNQNDFHGKRSHLSPLRHRV